MVFLEGEPCAGLCIVQQGWLKAVKISPAGREQVLRVMGPETKKLMDAIQKRLSMLVYVSIVGLLLTGLLQANRAAAFQGLFSFANPYSTFLTLKHILVLAMIAISLYRSLVLGRRTGTSSQAGQEMGVKLLLLSWYLELQFCYSSVLASRWGPSHRRNISVKGV